jgi:hypothetical protein
LKGKGLAVAGIAYIFDLEVHNDTELSDFHHNENPAFISVNLDK